MTNRIALLLTVLVLALLTLATHVAFASPSYKRSPSINTNVVMTYTFPITETGVDSLAFEVNGLCSVVYESAGSDDASLYAVPTGGTATGSGTLIVAYTDSSTVPTVFQPGTRWVRAVAVSAATGGSIMRITCSNSQMASTGEACGTSGLAPYVGTGGRYKCEAAYSYDEDANELSAGSISLDPVAGKNVVRFPGISGFTGPDPSATEVLLYGLDADQELYVENLDGLNAPSRVVTAGPDYYDVVYSWGASFTDVNREYADLLAAGDQIVQRFCMVKSPAVLPEQVITTGDASTTVTIPMPGHHGCSTGAGSTKPSLAYAVMGDVYIKDVWCTTNSNLNSLWNTGDEIEVKLSVSNQVEIAGGEYDAPAHVMTYGYDEIIIYKGAVGRNSELRESVGGLASTFFIGVVTSPLEMTLLAMSIESMTRAVGSTWNAIELQCSAGFMFKDTR